MEIEEIIEEIKSNLNGDSDHDKAYLASQMEKYREHEFGLEISLEIGRLLWTALTDEKKE
ncbi:MAG: hypothetical protein Q4P18_08255 [Methanobrevibacter sp.]|uniref:hypothetical protein n=1 Tax=Methanobrevibacter sp. TaxID=66852 RepID=UPI0026DFCE7C|nr:hypothetical protein [Methanobrevibacter sp.]MDO5849514.1 hypothetical protein [Methanobrevibacter sp.]